MPDAKNAVAEADHFEGSLDATDPDLEALPEPRRPGRRLTLISLLLTSLLSGALIFGLRAEVVFSLRSSAPTSLGELSVTASLSQHENAWVHATGLLGTSGAVRYSRPLESDSYRLAPVLDNPKVWVELRVPSGLEDPHFVAPVSFVGRLVSFDSLGLRHAGLKSVIGETGGMTLPSDAHLLIDGETPATTRWVLGLVVLLTGFFAFGIYGLARLLRPLPNE